jgi:hypothetical protein
MAAGTKPRNLQTDGERRHSLKRKSRRRNHFWMLLNAGDAACNFPRQAASLRVGPAFVLL